MLISVTNFVLEKRLPLVFSLRFIVYFTSLDTATVILCRRFAFQKEQHNLWRYHYGESRQGTHVSLSLLGNIIDGFNRIGW